MLLDFIVGCCVTFLCCYVWKNLYHWSPRILWHTWNIPGIPGYPIIGNGIHFIGTTEFVWKKLRKMQQTYSRMYKITGLNMTNVYLMDPNDAQKILNKSSNQKKGIIYQWVKCWLGNGLITSDGSTWKQRRKILNFSFTSDVLKGFVPDFEAESENSINTLKAQCENGPINILPIASQHGLFSLERTIIGKSVGLKREEMDSYDEGISQLAGVLISRLMSPWLIYDWTFRLSSLSSKLQKLTEDLHQFTRKILKARLDTWNCNSSQIETSKKKLPLLDLLITQMKTEGNINNEGICEELDTFVFAGHDTSSAVTSLTLMLLANNPDCQRRAYEEQKTIDNGLNDYERFQQMTYLDRCIKESLRLYPGVPFIGRELDTDLYLDDGICLPASLYVWVNIYDVHRNPKYWPEPDKFDPDRFLPENSELRHPYAYIPFSAGARNCIGQRFAVLQIKSVVSKIITNFRLEAVDTPDTVVFQLDFVTKPARPLKIKFIKRN